MEVRQRFDRRADDNESTIDEASVSTSSEIEYEPPENIDTPIQQSDWRKDRWNIFLLLFLYLLQGIPLGMAGSIPLIIQTHGASWSQQATFSFAFWPFSLKLLWAPIVDALYSKRFGRRKTWLIPTQYAIGAVMILLSYHINSIIAAPATPAGQAHPRQ
jgi:MFS transporter, PAT family, solute carrier family 33 (acetyl-CoA transportor), member 1